MSGINGFINPDLVTPSEKVARAFANPARRGALQIPAQVNLFNQGAKAGMQNTTGQLIRGAAGQVLSKANVPIAIASAGIPLARATGEMQRESGQTIPTQLATQTKEASGLGWDKPGQSYSTMGVSPRKMEVNTSFGDAGSVAALPKVTMPQYDIQGNPDMDVNGVDFDLMRNHFATAGNLPYNPEVQKDVPPAIAAPIAYNPSYESNVNANYDRSVNAIDSRMKPAIDKTQALIDAFSNYDPNRTSGSSIGSQMALQAIGALTPQVANLHAEGAKQVGALPLMSQGLEAFKAGNRGPEELVQSNIKDNSALGQSTIGMNKAHTKMFEGQASNALTKQESKEMEMQAKALELARRTVKDAYPNGGQPFDAESKAYEQHLQMLAGNEPYISREAQPAIEPGWMSRTFGGQKPQKAVEQQVAYRPRGGANNIQSQYADAIQRAAGDPAKIKAINDRMAQMSGGR